ncbi:MAG: ion channel [Lysobacterales bacterium]
MLSNLLLGSTALIINLGIQVYAIVVLLGYFGRRVGAGKAAEGLGQDMYALSLVILVLFLGHMLQASTWAMIFFWLGEFSDKHTALYHSLVNLTSLGYGDIVMSERHRLLGAMEAANGVLMFGLSAGSILSVMNRMFARQLQARGKTEFFND